MATPSKEGKTLVQFNVKNGKFKVGDGEIMPLTWLNTFSKEKNSSTKEIYGDGELQANLVNDRGFTGTLGMTARDTEFEIANGMLMEVDGGLAEIRQTQLVENAIYFETECLIDGVVKVKKVWALGVTITAPGESLSQTTSDINESAADYPITVNGVNLKNSTGMADYINPATGQVEKVFTVSKMPEDTGYEEFGDTVPVPKVKTGA